MGYQTFPWMAGDSRSYHKLLALQLPNLKNRSFLDVGCNEGYFCGYAHFLGANKVTGIDINPQFLSVAKSLFPDCTFICQSWERLGAEQYDVILNASAIHYAQDQKELIDLLMSRLAPHGTLVLEIGVAPGTENKFIEVKRSIDSRLFPTKSKLTEMLDGYAYKFVSRSTPQAGDPIPREVYHISRKLPYAVLLLDEPHSGKSFTINELFKESLTTISGDRVYYDILNGKITSPEKLSPLIEKYRKHLDCGSLTIDICKNGLLAELTEVIETLSLAKSFILDMYLPRHYRRSLARHFEDCGYFVVNVQLQAAISHPRLTEKAPKDSAWRYYKHLQNEFMINEKDYLAANPDVAKALAEGKITSALAHYIFHGRSEGRKRTLAD